MWKKTAYYAREGSAIGKRLDSSFVEAVGLFRLGHAYELEDRVPWDNGKRKAAIDCYEGGIAKAKMFKVTRVQVEPLWGLARVYGYAKQLVLAEQYAVQAMEIALRAGDQWLYYLVRLSLGASLAMAGHAAPAEEHLLACTEGFTLVERLTWRGRFPPLVGIECLVVWRGRTQHGIVRNSAAAGKIGRL